VRGVRGADAVIALKTEDMKDGTWMIRTYFNQHLPPHHDLREYFDVGDVVVVEGAKLELVAVHERAARCWDPNRKARR